MDDLPDSEPPSVQIEHLKARIHELEDFQERVETNAAESIQMAEDLETARAETALALRKERESQDTIRKLALFDPLTNVANRNLFHQRFEEAINASKRDGGAIALMLFDIDDFKNINDTFGHPVGDELLRCVSRELVAATRETDTVARLGGDEFAIILAKLAQLERVIEVAERIIDTVTKPVNIDGALIKTGTSIGIALYPRDGMGADELLRAADMALYAAKSKGKSTFVFFDGALDARARASHVLNSDMRLAIVRQEFLLHYQPQLKSDDEEYTGVEALVRWRHPSLGLLAPSHFINAAEQGGLLAEIGKFVLKSACRQFREWLDAGYDVDCMSVNVSPMEFQDPEFVGTVKNTLAETKLDPSRPELEITETIMMKGFDQVVGTLNQLRQLGVGISIDDFGTGYSSLAYLRKLPIQTLKIDKSFVDNIPEDKNDLVIIEAILNMSRSLGIEVVAEGIESTIQMHALLEMGCTRFQGYLIAAPMAPEAFLNWMSKRPRRRGRSYSRLRRART